MLPKSISDRIPRWEAHIAFWLIVRDAIIAGIGLAVGWWTAAQALAEGVIAPYGTLGYVGTILAVALAVALIFAVVSWGADRLFRGRALATPSRGPVVEQSEGNANSQSAEQKPKSDLDIYIGRIFVSLDELVEHSHIIITMVGFSAGESKWVIEQYDGDIFMEVCIGGQTQKRKLRAAVLRGSNVAGEFGIMLEQAVERDLVDVFMNISEDSYVILLFDSLNIWLRPSWGVGDRVRLPLWDSAVLRRQKHVLMASRPARVADARGKA